MRDRRRAHTLAATLAVAVGLALVPSGPSTAATTPAGTGVARACADAPADRFVDVATTSVHADAIDCAAAAGIVQGSTDGRYRPAALVSRGQMASFIVGMMRDRYEFRLPVADAFDDDQGSLHEDAIDLLASVGVIQGVGERRYAPDAPVTRAQMTTYLIRAFETATHGLLPEGRNAFRDDDGSVHEPSIDRATAAGLAAGVAPGTFAPGSSVRRDQMASFVVRTFGCLSLSAEDASCASYAGGGIAGFTLSVTADRASYVAGDPVVLHVEACNRRSTALGQRFPQRDWATVELLDPTRGWLDGQWNWYDDRLTSLAGAGYDGTRDPDPVWRRIAGRQPRLVSLTWVDGPQRTATEDVTWQPGECKRLPLPAWQQADNTEWGSGNGAWVADWAAAPTSPGRARPGPYVARVHWGGVEAGGVRRFLSVDSAPFTIDGPTIRVRQTGYWYAVGAPVPLVVEACNRTSDAYVERWTAVDVAQSHLFSVRLQGSRGDAIAHVFEDGVAELHWAPGECRTWDVTWDQRDDGVDVTSTYATIVVDWHHADGDPARAQQHTEHGIRLR